MEWWMERFSWLSLVLVLQVVLIDVVMSGDNALMIGMTVQTLKKEERKKAIILGLAVAAVLRVLTTFVFAQLLDFPALKILWWLLLIGIAANLYRQFRNKQTQTHHHKQGSSLIHALWLIVLADITMSLDNALAVAGAVGEHPRILLVGIILSIIMMMTIATSIAKLIDRFPWIQRLGFALIVFVAFKLLFAGISALVPETYHDVFYRVIGVAVTVGAVLFHHHFVTSFEMEEVAPFLLRHAPFLITFLLMIIGVLLARGQTVITFLDTYTAIKFTVYSCMFLLIIEMASLEHLKWKHHHSN